MRAEPPFVVSHSPLHGRMGLRQGVQSIGDASAVRHVDLDSVGAAGVLAQRPGQLEDHPHTRQVTVARTDRTGGRWLAMSSQ